MKPSIKLVVSDLDNTLYDWIGFFVPAFYEMLETASRVLHIPMERLTTEFRAINRQFGTSEKPFALLELPSVQSRLQGLTRDEQKVRLDDAFHAFNRVRKQNLRLYDGVLDTLKTLTANGTVIVAHTDAHVHNAMFRIKALGLDGMISRLYAPISELDSDDVSSAYGDFVSALPAKHKKPNPDVLLDICSHHDVEPRNTLYVGDSMTKDIQMANAAGVHSAFASYGTKFEAVLWQKLVTVTHWSPDDAKKESETHIQVAHPEAEVELASFSEILHNFEFVPSDQGQTRPVM